MKKISARKVSPGHITALILVAAGAAVCVFPLLLMLQGSFRHMIGAMETPSLLPGDLTLENYVSLITSKYPVFRWLLNSICISAAVTFFSILVCCTMGYSFGKKRFPGRTALFTLVLAVMMLPKQSYLIPLFITVKNMGLVNNILGVILPAISWPYGIFLMRQFMQDVPDDLIEYARIEGAGELKIFTSIVLPLVKPAIATLGILQFMASWGDFMWQLIILKKTELWTMNVGISVLIKNPAGGSSSVIDYGLAMAGGVIAALPVIILFLCLQKYFIKGLTLGAVKA